MKNIIETETKREKFVRLVESRMNNTLKNLELLCNLSNTSNYDYTRQDVEKILRTLKSAVNDVERCFNKSTSSNKKFKL